MESMAGKVRKKLLNYEPLEDNEYKHLKDNPGKYKDMVFVFKGENKGEDKRAIVCRTYFLKEGEKLIKLLNEKRLTHETFTNIKLYAERYKYIKFKKRGK